MLSLFPGYRRLIHHVLYCVLLCGRRIITQAWPVVFLGLAMYVWRIRYSWVPNSITSGCQQRESMHGVCALSPGATCSSSVCVPGFSRCERRSPVLAHSRPRPVTASAPCVCASECAETGASYKSLVKDFPRACSRVSHDSSQNAMTWSVCGGGGVGSEV